MTRDEPLGNFDVAIVGGGIVGLAHAWRAVRRGYRVLLLERTQFAQGASVRNFGMIWPVGQPAGELYQIALQSREFWMQLGAQGVTSVEACGSLHLAHQPDELDVLQDSLVAYVDIKDNFVAGKVIPCQVVLAVPESVMIQKISPQLIAVRKK